MGNGAATPETIAKTCEAAAFGDVSWAQALADIAGGVGGIRGILLGANGSGSYSHSCIYNHDPDVAVEYNSYYNRFDPRTAPSLAVPQGETRLGQALVRNEDIAHTEYFDAISLRGDIADSVFGAITHDAEVGRRTISIQRSFSQDFFGESEARFLAACLPALDACMRQSLRVARIMAQERCGDAIAYGLLGQQLEIELLGGAELAEEWRAGPLSIRDGRLVCGNRALKSALSRAASNARSGQSASLRCGAVSLRVDPVPAQLQWFCSGGQQVFVTVSRDTRSAEPDFALFAECFGLTPREAAVLAALAAHETLPLAAASLGLATETMRWHAKNICAKTGHHGVRKLVEAARANDLSNLE